MRTERDVPVTDHHALARRQRADLEVAHLHDGDPIPTIANVVVQPALDPGVVHLQHHAEPGGARAIDEVERIREGVQEPEIDAQLAHRLDRQPHAETLRVVEQRFQQRPRAGGRLLPGEARSVPGQDEQAAGADLRRRREVIPGPREGVGRGAAILERKEPRGGQAGRLEAGVAEEPCGPGHPADLQLPDRDADRGDAVRGKEGHVALEGPVHRRDLAHRDRWSHRDLHRGLE